MLSAGGQGSGTIWTAMHKSPRSCRRRGWPRLCDWARHPMLGRAPARAQEQRGRNARSPTGEAPFLWRTRWCQAGPLCCPVHTEQTDLPGWRTRRHGKTPVPRCAILDVVSCFPGVLQQHWIDVSVRCPHGERYNESASKPGVTAVAGEMEKTKRYGAVVRSLVFETYHL